MFQNLRNFFRLCKILKTRGNWPLIRKSKTQLWDFILCRNGLIQKPFFSAMLYWFQMLKGLDILVWRLETFGTYKSIFKITVYTFSIFRAGFYFHPSIAHTL